jgi:predicted anti-sigma-YlaC factor YlaD
MSRTRKSTTSCDVIQADLVEFADSTLDETRTAQVDQHVQQCRACRREVAQLRRSLRLAHSVWDARVASARDTLIEFEQLRRQRLTRHFSVANAVIATAAACTFVLIGWNATRPNLNPKAGEHLRIQENIDDPDASEVVDIETYLLREEQRARLASTIDVLAEVPTVVEDLERAKQYLRLYYGVTTVSGTEQSATPRPQQGT